MGKASTLTRQDFLPVEMAYPMWHIEYIELVAQRCDRGGMWHSAAIGVACVTALR